MLSPVMLLLQLLSSAEAGSKLQLSTAYLNLAHRFEQELGTLSNVSATSMRLRCPLISAISFDTRHHGRFAQCTQLSGAVLCTGATVAVACAAMNNVTGQLAHSVVTCVVAALPVVHREEARKHSFPQWCGNAAAGGHRHAHSLTMGEWVLWQQRYASTSADTRLLSTCSASACSELSCGRPF